VRFERDERQALQPLASRPYPGWGVPQPKAAPIWTPIEVQRRPLSVYAEAVR
jgi:hypothetical protein